MKITQLPPEVLAKITDYFSQTNAKTVFSLLLTCKELYNFLYCNEYNGCKSIIFQSSRKQSPLYSCQFVRNLKFIVIPNLDKTSVFQETLKRCKNLKFLLVFSCKKFYDKHFLYLERIPNISIQWCQGVNGEGFKYLKKGIIHFLDIEFCKNIKGKNLKYLKGKEIHTMNIKECFQFNSKDFEHFQGIQKLNMSKLRIPNDKEMDEALAYLKGIKDLNASRMNISNRNLRHLVNSIQILVVSYCSYITYIGLKYLKGIKSLDITACSQITDVGLNYLEGIKELKINYCTGVTGSSFYVLQNSVKILKMKECINIQKESFIHLCDVEQLDIDGCYQITDEYLTDLGKELKVLDISWCRNVTKNGFKNFQKIDNLIANGLRFSRDDFPHVKIKQFRV